MSELFFIENGRRRRGEVANCLVCNEEFIKRVGGTKKFCSPKCFSNSQISKVDLNCNNCGVPICKTPSKLKLSKHGFHFCGRLCKEKAQSVNGSCPEIQPGHYKNGTANYRKKNLSILDNGCVGCDEKRKFLLIVHHIDGDRENNKIENLEPVCGRCHMIRHLSFNGVDWVHDFKVLTSREDVEQFQNPIV